MAFALGRTPWELARSVTAEQFTWLIAYSRVEPFGFEVDNFRSGVVASTIAASAGKNIPPATFYPKVSAAVEIDTQTKEEQMRLLMMASPGNRKPN